MKLEDMSNMDLAYLEGFIKQCAERKLDPELFLESLTKKSQEGGGELNKPMPGGSDKETFTTKVKPYVAPKDPKALEAETARLRGVRQRGQKAKGILKLNAAKEETPKEEKPDYEKRRRMANVGLGATLGGLSGGLSGIVPGAAIATKDMHYKPLGNNKDLERQAGKGALIGAAAGTLGGAALGAGAAAIYNKIRNALGFSAMGTPVTEQKM